MLTSKEIAHLAVKALDDKLARDIQILKTDKVTVQPKSNKSKSDTSQSEKKDTSKQSANVSKSKQD